MWDFSWIADPSAWAGLGTLIVLEVVLGIDNLVFISILTSRLHTQEQRRRAFLTGLGLALVMRLVLLSAIAWIVSLTEPLVTIFGKAFSWRDFILMGGGIFLLLKGTMELHERLEGGMAEYSSAPTRSGFWQVIIQILVLDAVFSLDSIITSVGMVDHIPVMMLAVVVAMLVMVMAAAPLTSFVERHPTVIILCLGFLMMIGLSLLMDGLGYHIPKGYLYAAICFSVLVEICNQVALRNRRKRISMRDMRESMAMAVLGLLGDGRPGEEEARRDAAALASESDAQPLFEPEERDMVARVIRLSGRTARFIMTPRHRVRWLDSEADYATACRFASESLSPWLPVLDPDRDEVLGVIHTGDLAAVTPQGPVTGTERPGTAAPQDDGSGRVWSVRPLLRPAPTIFEHASLTEMLETFREEPTPLAFVRDEYGSVVGCITPTDLVSVLAGQMGDMPAGPEACRQPDGSWLMPGRLTVDAVTSWLGIHLPPRSSSATLAGLLLEALGHIPHEGERVRIQGWRMKIVKMDGNRIDEVLVRPGDAIKAGDPLVRYHLQDEAERVLQREVTTGAATESLRGQILDLERELVQARAERNRASQLAASGLGSRQALGRLEESVRSLQHRIELTQISIKKNEESFRARLKELEGYYGQPIREGETLPDQLVLTSPIDGYVLQLMPNLNPDVLLPAQATPVTVGQLDPVLIQVPVYEGDLGRIKEGGHARVEIPSLGDKVFSATITEISWISTNMDVAQPSYYTVELTVPNSQLELKPGFKALVRFGAAE